MASGMPWSRAAMPATAGALAFVTVKPGLAPAAARAMNRRTASNWPRVVEVELAQRARQVEPIHLGQVTRVRRRRQARAPGTPARRRRAARSGVVTRHVTFGQRRSRSAIVRPGARRPARSCRARAGARRPPSASASASIGGLRTALSATPRVRAIVGATSVGIADRLEGDEPDAVRDRRRPPRPRPAGTGASCRCRPGR